jgi:hypothetical protein
MLMVVPVDGSRPPTEVSHGVNVVAANVSSLAWSPDATRIAFAGRDGAVSRIYVAAADGSTVRAITDDLADRDLPSWSPLADPRQAWPPPGDWIGFREMDPDGVRLRLREVLADGSAFAEITLVIAEDAVLSKVRFSPVNGPLSYWWSPGSGTPAAAYIDNGFQHNGKAWTAGAGGFIDNGVPWSPDGTKLAMLTPNGVIVAENHVNTFGVYDGELRQLGPVADCWIDWVPDGSGLYGGSPGDCSRTVLIPLSQPSAPWYLPGSSSGTANWQPLAK